MVWRIRCQNNGYDRELGNYTNDARLKWQEEIKQVVLDFIEAETWLDCKRLVGTYADLLLTDAANQVFVNLENQYQGDKARIISERRRLLASCLLDGIDVAFADYLCAPTNPSELMVHLQTFISADTWHESLIVLEEHPKLLSDEALQLLDLLIQQSKARNEENVVHILPEYRRLLVRCRTDGIDALLIDRLSPASHLSDLLIEFQTLTHPSQMPRRIEVCEAMLTQINRIVRPQLWAALQGGLGDSFYQNSLGDRATNLEQAIFHFKLALDVFHRATLPALWATTQNDLANA